MSKSPNIFMPAIGVTGIVLGAAYGLSTRTYQAQEAEAAQAAASAAEARAQATADDVVSLEERIIAIQAEAKEAVRLAAASSSGSLTEPAPGSVVTFGLGRAAMPEEITAWDVDVLPDGRGLPDGSGSVLDGEEVFAEHCGSCHGDFAEGVDNWPVLAGGFNTLADVDPVKTVGSYWPHLSTVWDYVHRSMPFGGAQTLSDDDVYAIVAYILYSNDVVDEEFVLTRENFTEIKLHNAGGFITDDRAATEYPIWSGEPCMENCRDSVEITMRATDLNVTPVDEMAEDQASAEMAPSDDAGAAEGPDPQLIAAGEKIFKKCKACHQIGDNAKNRSGPQLNAVMGRAIGTVDGFKYSNVFKAAADAGEVWDATNLTAFLTKPKDAMAGTKMNFKGLSKPEDINAILAYLAAAGG